MIDDIEGDKDYDVLVLIYWMYILQQLHLRFDCSLS